MQLNRILLCKVKYNQTLRTYLFFIILGTKLTKMKNIFGFSIGFMLAISSLSYGQGSWLSASNITGSGDIIVTKMAIDNNNDIFISGWFNDEIVSDVGTVTSAGDYDIFLMKINSDGTHNWIKSFGGNFPDLPGNVVVGPDQTIYLSGSVNGTIFFDALTPITTNNADAFLANFNSDGSLNWVRIAAGGPLNQRAEAMAIDDQRVVIAGLARDSVIYEDERVGYAGFFTHISSFDLDGNHLDHNIIGFKDIGLPTSIASTSNGFVISGYFRDSLFLDIDSVFNASSNPSSDIYLYKTDKTLSGQWLRRTTSTSGENVGYNVKSDNSGGIYLVGKISGLTIDIDSTADESITVPMKEGGDFFLMKYENDSGNLLWYNIDGSNRDDALYSTLILPDRIISTGFYLSNYTFKDDTLKNTPRTKDIFIVEHDANGKILHARDAFSDPERFSDQGYQIAQNQNGDVIVTGVYRSEFVNFEDSILSNETVGDASLFVAQYGCKSDGNLITTSKDFLCYNDGLGELTLTATGGFTNMHYRYAYKAYIENGLGGDTVRFDGDTTIIGYSGGTWNITVYDNANCLIGTSQEVITEPDSLEYTYEVIQPDCYGASSGSIAITPSGGTEPYRYSINCGADFQNESEFSGLPPGAYCILVEDANGCQTAPLDTTLVEPDSIEYNFTVEHLVCPDANTGSIAITPAVGAAPFQYSVNCGTDFQTDSLFSGLAGGSYCIIVRDANGCLSVQTDTLLEEPDTLVFEYDLSDISCFGDDNGAIQFLNSSGGSGSFMFSIDGGENYQPDPLFTDLTPGAVQLAIMDDSSCVSEMVDEELTEPEELKVDALEYQNYFDSAGAYLEVTISGGMEPYTYQLKEELQSEVLSEQVGNARFEIGVEYDGLYLMVEVTDANGCGPIGSPSRQFVLKISEYDLLNARIYPNPTSGQVTVEMAYDKPDCLMEVLNITGQVVWSRRVFTSGGEIEEVIDLGDQGKGMYMIRMDGQTLRSGIVIH